MRIMVEARKPMKGKYYYSGVKDITVCKEDDMLYYKISFGSPEKADVYIPHCNYIVYETGWIQLEIEQ